MKHRPFSSYRSGKLVNPVYSLLAVLVVLGGITLFNAPQSAVAVAAEPSFTPEEEQVIEKMLVYENISLTLSDVAYLLGIGNDATYEYAKSNVKKLSKGYYDAWFGSGVYPLSKRISEPPRYRVIDSGYEISDTKERLEFLVKLEEAHGGGTRRVMWVLAYYTRDGYLCDIQQLFVE